MNNSYLTVEQDGQVAILTISRPERLNALDHQILVELDEALDELEADDQVGVIVITGAGEKAFIAGADIQELARIVTVKDALDQALIGQRVFSRLDEFPKPVIIAINGYALGGGCELALAGDIRIAAENAKFGMPEINLGIHPGWGGTQRLSHLVGRSRAKMLIFTGDTIDAQEAWRIGLVDQVVAKESFQETVLALAKKIASKSPIVLRLAKASINASVGADLESGCRVEAACFASVCTTQDRTEGIRAFLEKRPFIPTGQ
jgi:enoyl-CoA hydratase